MGLPFVPLCCQTLTLYSNVIRLRIAYHPLFSISLVAVISLRYTSFPLTLWLGRFEWQKGKIIQCEINPGTRTKIDGIRRTRESENWDLKDQEIANLKRRAMNDEASLVENNESHCEGGGRHGEPAVWRIKRVTDPQKLDRKLLFSHQNKCSHFRTKDCTYPHLSSRNTGWNSIYQRRNHSVLYNIIYIFCPSPAVNPLCGDFFWIPWSWHGGTVTTIRDHHLACCLQFGY